MAKNYPPELKEYAKIHGHICFGLAMGYRAGKCAQKEFGTFLTEDSEKVTVLLESGECTQEGIQLITPCSCQTGHLIQEESGKYVFIFYHRSQNKAIRVAARPKIMEAYKPIAALKIKMREKTATKAEIKLFWELSEVEVQCILEMPDQELFNMRRFEMAMLVKLNPFEGVYVPKKSLDSCKCMTSSEEVVIG